MEKQKSKREIILEKIDKRLKMIEKDPNILDYNYYNDKNFVGVKMTKETTNVTLNSLAKNVDQLSETVNQLSKDLVALTKLVIEGFTEQKKFNAEQRIINEEQKKFNEEQKKFNKKLENDIAEIKALPTIKKEIEESKKKK